MLATYAQIVRRSVAVTALAAGIMLAISGFVAGTKGAIGALIAIAIVTAFFGISIAVVGRAAKAGPHLMMAAALGTYLLKIVVLLILVSQLQGSSAFNARLFGLTAIVCVLVYSFAQIFWSIRIKRPYVQPDGR